MFVQEVRLVSIYNIVRQTVPHSACGDREGALGKFRERSWDDQARRVREDGTVSEVNIGNLVLTSDEL